MFSSPPNSSSHYSVDPLPFLLSDFMINIPSSPFSPLDNYSSSSIFLQPLMNMENHTTSMVDDVSKAKKKAPPRKRLSKKDRHSKIYTAKGLRDRRMRLSLDVARKFFDLQDMLGFDKASETVLWLLKQSESSVEQVKKTLIGNHEAIITENMIDCKSATSRSSSSPSITSECNVSYDMLDGSSSRNIINSRVSGSSSSSSRARKNVDPSIVRESRKMARARAKERTVEKMWIQSLNNGRSHVEDSSQLGQRLLKPSMEEEDAIAKQLLIGPGDQEHVVSGGHPQEHLYRDLQLLSKPWEAFNGPSYI